MSHAAHHGPWLGRAGKILRFEDANNEICNEFGPSSRPFRTAWHTGFARRASQVNQDCVVTRASRAPSRGDRCEDGTLTGAETRVPKLRQKATFTFCIYSARPPSSRTGARCGCRHTHTPWLLAPLRAQPDPMARCVRGAVQHSCTAELLAPAAAASSLAICAIRRATAASFVSSLRLCTMTVFEDSALVPPSLTVILSSLVMEQRTSPTMNCLGALFGAMPSCSRRLSYHVTAEITALRRPPIGGLYALSLRCQVWKKVARETGDAKVCAVRNGSEGPYYEYGLTLLATFPFSCWLRWGYYPQSIATLSTKVTNVDEAVSFIAA